MAGTFDFCDTSRVIKETAPETPAGTDMNGWTFTSKPSVPYRRSFTVKLAGMRWYVSGGALDITTNPKKNIGRLLKFYRDNQRWGVFDLNHEYLGNILCQFAAPVNPPEGLPDSDGLVETFEVQLLHYNPGY